MPRPVKEKTAPAELLVAANDRLNQFCGTTRIKKAVLSRLVMWFLDQPDAVRRVVLGEVTEGMEVAYAEALRALADSIVIDVDDPEAEEEEHANGDGGSNPRPQPASTRAVGQGGRHSVPSPGRGRDAGRGAGKPH